MDNEVTIEKEEDFEEVTENTQFDPMGHDEYDVANAHFQNYIDTLTKIKDERESIIAKLKDKYPGEKFFYTYIPYNGYYFYRKQDMSTVRGATIVVDAASDKLLTAFRTKHKDIIEKLDPETPMPPEIQSEFESIQNDIADMSNYENLKRCVVYPENIVEMIEKESLPSGIADTIIKYIFQVSGWYTSTTITEV